MAHDFRADPAVCCLLTLGDADNTLIYTDGSRGPEREEEVMARKSEEARARVARMVGEGTARYEAKAKPRRKNYELDQHRIDMLKEALGAKTETEAITLAMDMALEMTDFARELREGSSRLYGKGGFENYFDDESTLDFSGFAPAREEAKGKRRGVKVAERR